MTLALFLLLLFHFFYYFTSNSFSCLMSIVNKSKEQTESKVKIPPRAHLHRQRAILKSFNFLLHRCYACLIFQLSALDELHFQQDIKKNTKQSFTMRGWIVDHRDDVRHLTESYHNLMMMEFEISQTTTRIQKLTTSEQHADQPKTSYYPTDYDPVSRRMFNKENFHSAKLHFFVAMILEAVECLTRCDYRRETSRITCKTQRTRPRLSSGPNKVLLFVCIPSMALLRRALLFGWNMLILITVKHSRSHCVGYFVCCADACNHTEFDGYFILSPSKRILFLFHNLHLVEELTGLVDTRE